MLCRLVSRRIMRIAIFGSAGGVGSALAALLVRDDLAQELVLMDTAANHLASQVMDLGMLRVVTSKCLVRPNDLAAAWDCEVFVFAASVPHRDRAQRMDFLGANAKLLIELLGKVPSDWDGTFLIASNPVDALCTLAVRCLRQKGTVIGYVMNDTLRLREGIALATGSPVHEVEAWCIGEHGPVVVPVFSRVKIKGLRVELTAKQRAEATEYLSTWYDRWQNLGTGRTSVWTTSDGLARLIRALGGMNHAEIYSASVRLNGSYGLADICLGVPTIIDGRRPMVVEWEISSDEQQALLNSAARVRLALADFC